MPPRNAPERIGLIQALAIARSLPSEPHETLSDERRGPYLQRWIVSDRPDGSSVRIHRFLRSDGDMELHDHTSDCESLVLENGYWEVTESGRLWLGAGDRHFRPAGRFHRVQLEPGLLPLSLFVKGPRINRWGFRGLDGRWIAPEDFEPGVNPVID